MSSIKVSALTAKTTPSGSEELLINDGGTSKKITIANLPDTDTTYSNFAGTTAGLVPTSTTGDDTKFLRADGTWVVPTDTDTNTNQLTTFTVSATTDTTPTTISQGDDLLFTAGTGITCETTADGTVTITNTVTDTDTVYTHPTGAGNEHLPSSVSQTEAGYLDGVTSNIQTQLGTKLPLAGGTMTGTIAGFTSTGIDDNATSTAITIDSGENVTFGGEILAEDKVAISYVAGDSVWALESTAGDDFTISRNASQKFLIDGSTDNLTVTGNVVMASGKGIDFSATSDGSGTMTSEVLDDYEEGTWTPTTPSGAWTISSATYTKVGQLVTCCFDVQASATINAADFAGLPFTPTNNSAGVVGYQSSEGGATFAILVQSAPSWNFRVGATQKGLANSAYARGVLSYITA